MSRDPPPPARGCRPPCEGGRTEKGASNPPGGGPEPHGHVTVEWCHAPRPIRVEPLSVPGRAVVVLRPSQQQQQQQQRRWRRRPPPPPPEGNAAAAWGERGAARREGEVARAVNRGFVRGAHLPPPPPGGGSGGGRGDGGRTRGAAPPRGATGGKFFLLSATGEPAVGSGEQPVSLRRLVVPLCLFYVLLFPRGAREGWQPPAGVGSAAPSSTPTGPWQRGPAAPPLSPLLWGERGPSGGPGAEPAASGGAFLKVWAAARRLSGRVPSPLMTAPLPNPAAAAKLEGEPRVFLQLLRSTIEKIHNRIKFSQKPSLPTSHGVRGRAAFLLHSARQRKAVRRPLVTVWSFLTTVRSLLKFLLCWRCGVGASSCRCFCSERSYRRTDRQHSPSAQSWCCTSWKATFSSFFLLFVSQQVSDQRFNFILFFLRPRSARMSS